MLLTFEGLLWGLLSPILRTPDETQHVNSIMRVAEGGGWPRPGDAYVSQEVFAAMRLAGVVAPGRTLLPRAPERYDPRTNPKLPVFTFLTPTGVKQRVSLHDLQGAKTPYRSIDQMTQHPPGYYAVMAGVFDALSLDNWRYDRAIYLLRAFTALSLFVVPLCTYLTARRLKLSERAARFAAFVPAAIPMVGFLGGSVTNDGLTIAFCSLGALLLATVATRAPTWRRLGLLGLVVGLACLLKGTALVLIPLVPLAVLLGVRAGGARGLEALGKAAPRALLSLVVAFVIGGWWWALNVVRYGTVQPAAYELKPAPLPLLTRTQFAGEFFTHVGNSFFGNFGQLELPLPYPLTWALSALFIALIAVSLLRRRFRGAAVLLLLSPLLSLALLLQTTHAAHVKTHLLPGMQGRYLFPALVPLSVLVALGLERIAKAVRVPRVVFVVATVGGLVLAVYGALWAFAGYYWEPGTPFMSAVSRWLSWSPYSWRVIAGLLVVGGLASIGVLVSQIRRAPERAGLAPSAP